MPTQYQISTSPRARKHLRRIFEFIAKDSPQNASKMVGRILDAIDSLEILPYRYGPPRGSVVKNKAIRSMPVWPYLVRYRIDEPHKTVYIVHVRHGARRK